MSTSNRPVLLEASHAINLRHIIVWKTVHVVDTAIAFNLAEDFSIAWNASAVGFDDIPLGDGVSSPSVDSQSPIAGSSKVAVPCNRAITYELA
jgi:hypothetical protein